MAGIAEGASIAVTAERAIGFGWIRADPARWVANTRVMALVKRRANNRAVASAYAVGALIVAGASVAIIAW